jgi:hypothetical protein
MQGDEGYVSRWQPRSMGAEQAVGPVAGSPALASPEQAATAPSEQESRWERMVA